MACQDPYVSSLHKQFNAVPLKTPDSRFAPCTVLLRKNRNKGSFTWHGYLQDLLVNHVDLPKSTSAQVSDFEGKKTKELSLGFGLEILADFLVAQQTIASVKTKFKNTKNVTFQFKNITRNYIEDIQLGKALKGQKLDNSNPFLQSVDYIWVINQSFTSDQFQINADNSNTVGLGAEVPIPGHAIGAPISLKPKFELDLTTSSESHLSFKSGEPQTFAFTCLRFKVGSDGSITHMKTITREATEGLNEPTSALIQVEPRMSWRSEVAALGEEMLESPPKLALLIGINHYKHINGLSGCVEDVMLMEETLINKFGFREEHIIRLRGEEDSKRQPNAENIRTAFDELKTLAQQHHGAIIVIHYSGHGSYRYSETKASHQDETIVPCDSGRLKVDGGTDPNEPPSTDIPDTEIRTFLEELSQHASHLAVIFDCCHSQSLTRGRSRQVGPDSRIGVVKKTRGTKVSPSEWTKLDDKAVVIAACEYNDVAQETEFGQKSYGVLTYYLTQELNNVTNPSTTTYKEVFDRAATAIKKAFFKQIPKIEGNSDFTLFSMQTLTSIPYAVVTSQNGQQITLDQGAVHGVTVNSQYELYTNAALKGEGAICTATIRDVTSVNATAEVANTNQLGDLVGLHAIEVEHYGSDMRIQVSLPNERQEDWKQQLHDHPLIDIAKDKSANLSVDIDSSHSPLKIVVTNRFGEIQLPRKDFDDQGMRDTVENLKKYAQYHFGLSLNNDNSPLQHQISMKLYRSTDQSNWQLTDNTFFDHDYIMMEVKQTSDKALYFALLSFDETGAVEQLYPLMRADAEPLKKNDSIQLKDNKWKLGRNLPFTNDPDEPAQCALKLFVTEDAVNYRPLLQSGYRAKSRNKIEELLSNLISNRSWIAVPGDWTILTKFYKIFPKVEIPVCIERRVEHGDCIAVVGSLPSLGSWDPANGVKLKWNPQDKWQGCLILPKASYVEFEWKFVILHTNAPPTWEYIPNRRYSSENSTGDQVYQWNNEERKRSFPLLKSEQHSTQKSIVHRDFFDLNYRHMDINELSPANIPPTYSLFTPPEFSEQEIQQLFGNRPQVQLNKRPPELRKILVVIIGEPRDAYERKYFDRDVALANLESRMFKQSHEPFNQPNLRIGSLGSAIMNQAVYSDGNDLELFIELKEATNAAVRSVLEKVFEKVDYINILYGGHGKAVSGNMLLKDNEEFTYEQFTTIYNEASRKRGYNIYGALFLNSCYSHIWQNQWDPLTEALGGVQRKNFRINGTTTKGSPLAPIEGDLKDKILKGISLLLGLNDMQMANLFFEELKQLLNKFY